MSDLRRAAAALIVPVLCMLPGAATAADADGRFAVKSVGGTTCSQFVEIIKSQQAKENQEPSAKARIQNQIALYVGWLSGYISAANQLEPKTFDLASWQDMRTLTALLTRHCDRNADLRFAAAAAQMVNALKSDRLETSSEVVQAEHEGKSVQLYQEALRRAQAALAQLGKYSGAQDGQLGEDTRAALSAFQEENKLPVSGIPDQATLFSLFRAVHKSSE